MTSDDADPPWYDHIYIGAERPDGLMVEVVHTLTRVVDDTLDLVLGSGEPNPPALDAIKGIVDSCEASGARAHLITDWKHVPPPIHAALRSL